MSAEHVGWAFRQDAGSPTRKLVLVALADRCNKDTLICRPLIKNLAEDCNLSDRAARQAIKDLCDQGLIGRLRRRRADGSLSGYDYVFPSVQNPAPPAAADAGSPAAGDAGQEPEVDLEPEVLLAAAPRQADYAKMTDAVRKSNEAMKKIKPPPRARNPIWDALGEVFGEPTTPGAVKVRGKVCAGLTAARADPSEVVRRARSWPAHFDGATMTDLALEKHWDTLGRKPLRRR